MRIIVALALVPFLQAQSPREPNIARLEANLAQHPGNIADRERLIQLYYDNPSAPIDDASRDARRRHVLWLIENHPDVPGLAGYFDVLERTGPKADPDGSAEAARLWREQIQKPGASPKILANAAWFFKISDRSQARTLIERASQIDPADHQVARVRGMLDVLAWLGVTELQRNDVITAFDPNLRKSAPSTQALEEIESSQDAALVASAGQFPLQQFDPAFQAALDDQDPLELAERWVQKARQLEPGNAAWNTALATVHQRQAGASLDPHWKVQLLGKAEELAAGQQRLRIQSDLADAEFLAGDDQSAERDAIALLESSDPLAVYSAHTLLGRVALGRGDVTRAKEHLLDSARTTMNSFTPRMTLAQELLDRGERDVVAQYLDLCRAFWKNDRGFIDHFEPIVQKGGKPDLLAFYNPNPQPPPKLSAPQVVVSGEPAWKPVAGAESYVVEWDVQKNGRWMSEAEGSFRVIPTRGTTARIDSAPRVVRWRVFAVNRTGRGEASAWQTIDLLQ